MAIAHRLAVRSWLVPLLGLLLLTACAGNPAANLPPLQEQAVHGYTLRSGDQIRIVVFGQTSLPTDYVVDDQGDVSMPLVGSVEANGLTAQELQQRLTQKFTKVLVDPSVSVQVISPRPVFILGGVNKPGAFPYAPGMTVMSLAALASGFTEYAYEDYVKVTRTMTDGTQRNFRATGEDHLRPADIVFVYERYKQY